MQKVYTFILQNTVKLITIAGKSTMLNQIREDRKNVLAINKDNRI